MPSSTIRAMTVMMRFSYQNLIPQVLNLTKKYLVMMMMMPCIYLLTLTMMLKLPLQKKQVMSTGRKKTVSRKRTVSRKSKKRRKCPCLHSKYAATT